MRAGAVLKLVLATAAIAVVAVVAVVKSIDLQGYRRLIAEQTGRELTFGGEFRLTVSSLRPRLVATDVTLANTAGGSRGHMLRIVRLEAELALVPLLRREAEVRRLTLSGVDLLLERGNWRFDDLPDAFPSGGSGVPHTSLAIEKVLVDKLHLRWRDDSVDVAAVVDSLKIDAAAGPLSFAAAGSFEQRRFDVSGVVGSLPALLRPARPFPVTLKMAMGGMAATLDGTVAKPLDGEGLDLRMAVEGSEIAEAGKLLDRDLPALGPFRAIARVTGSTAAPRLVNLDAAVGRREAIRLTARGDVRFPLSAGSLVLALSAEADHAGAAARAFGLDVAATQPLRAVAQIASAVDGYRIADLRAAVGRSDMEGRLHVGTDGAWPTVSATLASRRIDAADFGFKPGPEPVATAPGAPLFSDRPLSLDAFADAHIDVAWRADEALVNGLSLRQAVARLAFHDDVLRIEPLSAQVADGRLLAGVTLDGRGGEPSLVLVLDAQSVDFGKLLAAVGTTRALSGGRGDLRANLAGTGASPRAIVAALDGDASLVMGEGAVELGALAPHAAHLAGEAAPWMRGDQPTPLGCFVAKFDVRKGRATSRAFLLDAAPATVGGDVDLDLDRQFVSARLVPHAKEASLLGVARPIELAGPLTDPTIRPAGEGAPEHDPPLVLAAEGEQNACLAALTKARPAPVAPPLLPVGGTLSGTIGKNK